MMILVSRIVLALSGLALPSSTRFWCVEEASRLLFFLG
jgi:hypothetical protein